MKQILHITNHIGTTKNINSVFKQLNLFENLKTENCPHGFYIDSVQANNIWNNYKEYIHKYNILIFTDTSMVARPFLQNIDDHECLIIIYITNRFDWGIWNKDDLEYYKLYSSMSTHKRVRFCSDNNYDQYYAEQNNISFYFDKPIKLIPYLQDTIINENKINNNKLFIYSRGTSYEKYKDFLYNNKIEHDVFGGNYSFYRDFEHISEYKAFLHLPYQVNIQTLWECLGYNIVYFIPSKTFIYDLIKNTSWYYWEEKTRINNLFIKSIEIAEWYTTENEDLFFYFDSWEDLKEKIINLTDYELIAKKKIISDFMKLNNHVNIKKWKNLIDN
jgi:hypothetical protein